MLNDWYWSANWMLPIPLSLRDRPTHFTCNGGVSSGTTRDAWRYVYQGHKHQDHFTCCYIYSLYIQQYIHYFIAIYSCWFWLMRAFQSVHCTYISIRNKNPTNIEQISLKNQMLAPCPKISSMKKTDYFKKGRTKKCWKYYYDDVVLQIVHCYRIYQGLSIRL